MPIVKEPLTAKCFQCKNSFSIKYVPARKEYSKKNDWDYWTENDKNKDKKICDSCLIKLYNCYKWEFRKLIRDEKKRRLLRQYIAIGTIGENLEPTFIIQKKKKKQGESNDKNIERERERESKMKKNG